MVVEVVDHAPHGGGATAAGTVLACQVTGPEVVDDHHGRMVAALGAAAVAVPLGDRAWGHRSFSVGSPAGAEVVVHAERADT